MADEQEIRPGARDDFTADFVRRWTNDGTPETGGEQNDENDEEEQQEPARARRAGSRKTYRTGSLAYEVEGMSGLRSSPFTIHFPPQPSWNIYEAGR
jgi:hypothetical protein